MSGRIAGLGIAVFVFGLPVESQGLFESSQEVPHEKLVSSNFTLGGFLQSSAYTGNHPQSDQAYFQAAYSRLGLLMDAKAGPGISAHAELRMSYGSLFNETYADLDLREAYVEMWSGPLSFRMGKMLLPWGKSSFFNPVDRLGPKDPTVRSPYDDDLQLGSWAIQSSMNLGPAVKLSATWNPLYTPSVLLIDPVPLPDYVHFADPVYPGPLLKEGSLGLNLDLRTSLIDVGIYGFQGYHTWPGIAYNSMTLDSLSYEPVELQLAEKAYRIRMAGLDFSLPLGSAVLRAEGAWFESLEDHSGREYLPLPELSYAAEIEYSAGNIDLIGGYYGKYILDYTAPEASPSLGIDLSAMTGLMPEGLPPSSQMIEGYAREQIASFNRLYNYQAEQIYHSVYGILRSSLFYDKLEVQLPLSYHISTREWILQPRLSYRPVDGFEARLGYTGWFGPENSLMDFTGPAMNALYLSFKLSF